MPDGSLPYDPIDEARRQWVAHGWEQAATGMAAVTSLMRGQQIMSARAEAALRGLGLTFARYEVLMILLFSRRGALPMRVIGSRLQVHPTSVTNAVDRLEADGLVVRVPHPEDRRGTLAEITPVGRRLARRATGHLNTELFADVGLSEAQLDALVKLLRALRRSAGDF